MGRDSGVIWTHHTFNPWWGCTKISPGCKNCYAAAWDARFGGEHWGGEAPRKFFGDRHWNTPRVWDRAAAAAGVKRLVFCASMADVFEERGDLFEPRRRLFALMDETPNLVWLVLTKRPENISRLLPWSVSLPNVWMGTTIEDDEWERLRRVIELQRAPAAGRFLSCEPLLSDVRVPLDQALDPEHGEPRIDWVIAGAESGDRKRDAMAVWFERAQAMTTAAERPFFFKQAVPTADQEGTPPEPLIHPSSLSSAAVRRDGISEAPKLNGRQWLQAPRIDGLDQLPVQRRYPNAML